MERATFVAGSFERVEETFRRIEGVQTDDAVGYVGGWAPDPSYFDVCTGTTGHAEVVEIYFDPGQISCEQLPNVFWGASKERLRQRGKFTRPIVTEIVPVTGFYGAKKIPPASCREAGRCGLSGMRW